MGIQLVQVELRPSNYPRDCKEMEPKFERYDNKIILRQLALVSHSKMVALGWSLWVGRCGLVAVGRCGLVAVGWLL